MCMSPTLTRSDVIGQPTACQGLPSARNRLVHHPSHNSARAARADGRLIQTQTDDLVILGYFLHTSPALKRLLHYVPA